MAMDGIALGAVINECQPLVGGKIDKVQQPEKDLLLFTVRSNTGTQKLLVSTHAENGRIQLTNRSFDNPQNAPAFCMLLRRRLVGGRICSIRQLGADRVCEIIVLARNELFDEVALRLIAELTGKHANLLLLEPSGTIVDCVRRISSEGDAARILLPGFPYEPIPAQEKRNPFTASCADLERVYRSPDPAREMTAVFSGVSKQTASALLSAASTADELGTLFRAMKEASYSPSISYGADGEPVAALPFLPGERFAKTEPVQTMNEALERYYADRDRIVNTRRRSAALRHTVSTALSRAQNKYAAFLETIHGSDSFEAARMNGELILANLHLAKSGMRELVVDDYFADPPARRAVALDPAFSAQDNAKRYFKQYRKGKLGKAYAEGQIESLAGEIQYLEGQLENIDKCDTLFELSEIREELVRERYLRPEKAQAAKPSNRSSQPMRFVSDDGIPILIGKNNRQNDALTFHTARPDNLWLHAKNIPGSHVVIDFPGEPPENTLREAAMLAAYFSQARASSGVPVDYTPRKFIKKPSGSRPGMVVYSTNRTIFVSPEPSLAQRLRSDQT
jgi:predicted ribosome quality control (RQC) complex YloA/Tae2 family protein